MAEGSWRAWAKRFTYKRPYEDAWGTLHDPTGEWDELLKYYQHWVRLIVSDAARRMARPASAGALKLIRAEERRRRQNLARAHKLEADYLEWADRRKHWKRRRRNQARYRASRKGSHAAQVR